MLLPGSQRRGGIHRHGGRRLFAAIAVVGTTFRVGADELEEQVGGVARSQQNAGNGADDTGGQVRQLDCDYAMVRRMADRLVTQQVPPPTSIAVATSSAGDRQSHSVTSRRIVFSSNNFRSPTRRALMSTRSISRRTVCHERGEEPAV